MTAMLDSMIYDKLIIDEAAQNLLLSHVKAGSLIMFCTSVQINELNAIPDENKRSHILSLLRELSVERIPVDYAPYGMGYGECYGGLSPHARLKPEVMVTSRKHVSDAMIAITASSMHHSIDLFVTEDIRLRRKLNKQQVGTIAVSLNELLATIRPSSC
jgi:hypothetical protein